VSAPQTSRVVEWSPTEVVAYDHGTRQVVRAANFVELAKSMPGGPVIAAVSRRASFLKAVRLPNAGAAELDLILHTQMTTMFPVPLHELAYSYRLSNDVTDEGRLTIVAAMRESDLVMMQSDAKEAGFKLERVIPTAFGSMYLAEANGQSDLAVVHESSEGLCIDLLAGGELRYSRVAPMPANPDLIDSEVNRSFQAVGLPCAPTLAAGGFPYAEAEYKTSSSALEMLATSPLDRLGIHLETHATRLQRDKARQSNRVRLAALLCAAAVLMALLVFFERSDRAEEVRVANARWQRELTGLRTESKKLGDEVGKLQTTSGTLQRAFQPAQTPSDVLTLVSNYTPGNLWLTGITFERGKIMYIRGTSATSESVATYLQALTAEPRLRDVKLVFANNAEIDKTPVVQFSIQAFPVGNLPLLDPKTKGSRK